MSAVASSTPAGKGDNDAVGEEGIMVAIRMRPLNSKESHNNSDTKSHRVWRVLQKYNSVTQCTPEGKPLPERINGRNFFTYDRTFGEGSTTRQVYDEVARGIVGSVTNGLNGTIFAYGQTSSGKTFTMQGSGSMESNFNLNTQGGIVHMSASDIFSHIERNTDRVFLVRVSFIEIYNEEVRDLLVSGGDDNTLSVREDPRRGVFVNSNETIVTGLDSLLSVLFAGEKNRSVASTGMNERSSRSHTIFRITVESRLKNVEKVEEEDSDHEMEDCEDNELNNGNGAVRVSTLNLVDLAGSESVRHTGATGDRQKEGGKINQSLLTLSRVIGSLGQNATHINFRDSKLTRILQPALSGNARMAVICCATPSELYLEETRSTLQFASRAKLVKTRAQVNEVLDDRSLIKKLQRELKEARDAGNSQVAMEQMKALEEKAVNEAEAKRKAEQDLKRMKDLILKGGVLPMKISFNGAGKSSLFKSLFVYNDADETLSTDSNSISLNKAQKGKDKRRYSDGGLKIDDRAAFNSPKSDKFITKIQAKTEIKPKKPKSTTNISISALTEEDDIGLLRKALKAKSDQTSELKWKLSHMQDQSKSFEQKLERERGEKEMLRLAKQDLEYQVTALASDKDFIITEQGMLMSDKEDEISSYLSKIERMLSEGKEQAQSVGDLNALVESLRGQICSLESKHAFELETLAKAHALKMEELQSHMSKVKNEYAAEVESLNQERSNELMEVQSEIVTLRNQIEELHSGHASAVETLKSEHASELETLNQDFNNNLDEAKSEVERLHNEINMMSSKHAAEAETIKEEHSNELSAVQAEVVALRTQMEKMQNEHVSQLAALSEEHNHVMSESCMKDKTNQVQAAELENAAYEISELKSSLEETKRLLEQAKNDVTEINSNLFSITIEKEELISRCASQTQAFEQLQLSSNITVDHLKSQISDMTEQSSQLELEKAALQAELCKKSEHLTELSGKLEGAMEANETLEGIVEEFKISIKSSEDVIGEARSRVASLESDLKGANAERESLADHVKKLEDEKAQIDNMLAKQDEGIQSLTSKVASLTEENSLLQAAKEASEEHLARLNQAITTNNSSNAEQLSEISTLLQESENKLSKATQELVSTKTHLMNKESTIIQLEEQIGAINSQLQILSAENRDLQLQNNTISDELLTLKECSVGIEKSLAREQLVAEDLLNQLESAECETLQLQETINAHTARIQALEDNLSAATNQNAVLTNDLETSNTMNAKLVRQEEALTSERDDLVAKLKEAQAGSESAAEALTETASKLAAVEKEISELKSENATLKETAGELEAKSTQLQTELESQKQASKAKISELSSENDRMNANITELTSTIESKVQELSCIQSKNEALESESSNLRITSLELEKRAAQLCQDLVNSRAEITSLKSSSKQVDEMESSIIERDTSIQKLEQKLQEKDLMIDALNCQISETAIQLESANAKNDNITAKLEVTTSDLSALQNELASKLSKITECESAVNTLTLERDTVIKEKNDLARSNEVANAELAALQNEYLSNSSQLTELQSTITKLKSALNEAETQRDSIAANLVTLQSEASEIKLAISTITTERDAAETRARELLSGNEGSMKVVASLQSEKAELVAKVEECIARLDSEKEETQAKMSLMRSSINELEENKTKLNNDLSKAKSETAELLSIAEQSESDYNTLLAEREDCIKELEDAIRRNEEFVIKISQMETQHKDEICKLQQSSSATLPTEDSESVDMLKKEINELRTLLSSANESVEDARDAALEADRELEEKEAQLEQALRDLAEADEKVISLQSLSSEGRMPSDSEEELLRDMELLMNEKVEAESRLEDETRRRKEYEDEVQKAAEEEKQLLMAEAEEKMVLLRDEISRLRSDLSRVENELYTTKDDVEDLRNQNQRFESKANDAERKVAVITTELNQAREAKAALQQQFDQLQEESTTFKSQVFAAKAALEAEAQSNIEMIETKLSEALSNLSGSQNEIKMLNEVIYDLNSDIEEYKQQLNAMENVRSSENDLEVSRLREELATAKHELSTLNAAYHSAKNEVAAAKEKIAQVKKREHEKQQAFAQKAKDSIEQLQDRLKRAETKAKEAPQMSNETAEELKSLQAQVNELNNTLQEKDVRIKKLEKSKMTKEQVEKIRKMQEERVKFMTESRDYKQRVEELEREIAESKPRRYALRERTGSPKREEEGEVARLSEELKQCNLKLRKYVQFSDRLEKERKGVMAVISSCNVEDIAGNSVEEMVASLCEKLASIEEECDALANSEDKASKYLADLDSLRKKYADLENQLRFYKETNDELSNSHADCKASLKKAQEKIAALTKDKESLQASHVSAKGSMSDLQSEQRRQMQWLESENVQLGDELKRTKKELLQMKAQLDSVQKGSFGNDEATEELFGLSNLLESSSRQPLGSIKNSSDSEKKQTASNATKEKKRQLPVHSEDCDKENLLNHSSVHIDAAPSPFPSTKKQRKSVNPFSGVNSSVKKASRKITKALSDDSPKHLALGEEAEHTGELTSDCKQS